MENNIELLERYFSEAESASYANRELAERDRDYVDGKQLTDEEVAELNRRGQPPVVINRIRRKVDWLLGLQIKQRMDPRAHPRTPEHEKHAESISMALNFVCTNEDYDAKFLDVWSDMLVEGFGGMEVIHEDVMENGKPITQVRIKHYPWDRLFYDPHSRRADFSDARYKGAVAWMDYDDFVEAYPDKTGDIDGLKNTGTGYATIGDTYEDRPYRNLWYDWKRNRVRLILIWYRRKGEWHWCKFIGTTELEKGISPYLDDMGKTICPLIMHSAYCDRDNNRYGIVRDMIDPQDEINKRRSKLLHIANSRQTTGIAGAVGDVRALKAELAKPDGHIEVTQEAFDSATAAGIKPFEVIPQNDQATLQIQLLGDAKSEIDLMGSNAALAGTEGGTRTSGRAIQARQDGGMIEISALVEKSHVFSRTIYRHIWFMIKQHWTEERWVRVTDDPTTVRFVGLNRPLTLGEQLQDLPPEEAEKFLQENGLTPDSPQLQEQVGIANPIQDIDVDIIIDQSPDQVTLEAENFEAMLQHATHIPAVALIQANPAISVAMKEKIIAQISQPQELSEEAMAAIEKMMSEVALNIAKTAKTQAEAINEAKGQNNKTDKPQPKPKPKSKPK